MSSGLTEQRRKAAANLLQLVDFEGLQALRSEWHLSDADPVSILLDRLAKPPSLKGGKRDWDALLAALLDRLEELPRFKVLQLLLKVAEPTVVMLKDIVTFLEGHGISARTTGCAMVLGKPTDATKPDDEICLSPQEVGQVCSWSAPTVRALGDDPFKELAADWRSLRAGWNSLLARSHPRFEEGEMDVVATHLASRSETPEVIREPDIDLTDYRARWVLDYLLARVRGAAEILERIRNEDRGSNVVRLISDMGDLLQTGTKILKSTPARSSRQRLPAAHQIGTKDVRRCVPGRFLDTFDRFNEDLRLLADLTEAETILDVLRLDLWSSRPQLYEVWLLTSILDWIQRQGYDVQLLKVEPNDGGRVVWKLSYAKASGPCARVTGQGIDQFAFYQLYRPSGDMPDLCLLCGRLLTDKPVWAVDAKYSELGGYSLSSYQNTARRYRDSFAAPVSLVAEYFPRADLAVQGFASFEAGAALITDVRPGGTGLPRLLELLASSHPPIGATVVCVDCSSSFEQRREHALRELAIQLGDLKEKVLDSFVSFAGEAMTLRGMEDFIRSRGSELQQIPSLPSGTLLIPLMRELKRIAEEHRLARVVVVGDGDFSEPEALEQLRKEIHAVVDLYK